VHNISILCCSSNVSNLPIVVPCYRLGYSKSVSICFLTHQCTVFLDDVACSGTTDTDALPHANQPSSWYACWPALAVFPGGIVVTISSC
jgi:hypothetical protein